jgi:peptidoglycan/LPS O-acetylase OafA/YrhL
MLMWAFDERFRPLAALLAVAVAYASTRWIEEPIRRRRRRPVPVVTPQPVEA